MKRAAAADVTDRARAKFIEVLRHSCNVSEASRTAGIERNTAYRWRDADPAFAALWAEAEEYAADRLEAEAWRRAVDGTDKPVIHQGVITDTYKEYSDRMLEILLKGHRPERYVDKLRAELSGPGGAAIPMKLDISNMSAQEIQDQLRREAG